MRVPGVWGGLENSGACTNRDYFPLNVNPRFHTISGSGKGLRPGTRPTHQRVYPLDRQVALVPPIPTPVGVELKVVGIPDVSGPSFSTGSKDMNCDQDHNGTVCTPERELSRIDDQVALVPLVPADAISVTGETVALKRDSPVSVSPTSSCGLTGSGAGSDDDLGTAVQVFFFRHRSSCNPEHSPDSDQDPLPVQTGESAGISINLDLDLPCKMNAFKHHLDYLSRKTESAITGESEEMSCLDSMAAGLSSSLVNMQKTVEDGMNLLDQFNEFRERTRERMSTSASTTEHVCVCESDIHILSEEPASIAVKVPSLDTELKAAFHFSTGELELVPFYGGSTDVDRWIYSIEMVVRLNNHHQDMCSRVAALRTLPHSEVSEWFYRLFQKGTPADNLPWKELRKMLRFRFKVNGSLARSQWISTSCLYALELPSTREVEAYYDLFKTHLHALQVDEDFAPSDSDIICQFVSGLPEVWRYQLAKRVETCGGFNSTSLSTLLKEAKRLARLAEMQHNLSTNKVLRDPRGQPLGKSPAQKIECPKPADCLNHKVRCFNCGTRGHSQKDCTEPKSKCRHCNGSHLTLFHRGIVRMRDKITTSSPRQADVDVR